jgi:hypothetical protein
MIIVVFCTKTRLSSTAYRRLFLVRILLAKRRQTLSGKLAEGFPICSPNTEGHFENTIQSISQPQAPGALGLSARASQPSAVWPAGQQAKYTGKHHR